jgi:hypothetical protein
MRFRVVLTLLLVGWGPVPNAFGSKTKSVPAPIVLLQEADLTGRDFSPEERAYLLLKLAQGAVSTDKPQAKRWAEDLFQVSTKRMSLGSYRAAMQKNALTVLAQIDPDEAATLYRQLDTPEQWNEQVLLEDYRSFGARTVFMKLWSKHQERSLDTIESIAKWLGTTGQYPYAAITPIINDLAKTDAMRARSMFAEAVSFLPRDLGFANTNREFTNFLLATYKVPNLPLLKEALEAVMKSIEKGPRPDSRLEYSVQITSANRDISFSSESQFLIYRLLPLISSVDPDWAAELKEHDAKLRDAPISSEDEKPVITGAVSMPGDSPGPNSVADAMNESQLMKVQSFATSDPKQAAQIALSIGNPALRAIALATVAPSYADIDSRTAANWLHDASEEVSRLPSGTLKLRLMAALTKAKLVNHAPDVEQDLRRTCALGEELFAEDMEANPGKMAYNAEGSDELEDLIEVAAARLPRPAFAVDIARKAGNDLLRSHLLISAAMGLAARDGRPQS